MLLKIILDGTPGCSMHMFGMCMNNTSIYRGKVVPNHIIVIGLMIKSTTQSVVKKINNGDYRGNICWIQE